MAEAHCFSSEQNFLTHFWRKLCINWKLRQQFSESHPKNPQEGCSLGKGDTWPSIPSQTRTAVLWDSHCNVQSNIKSGDYCPQDHWSEAKYTVYFNIQLQTALQLLASLPWTKKLSCRMQCAFSLHFGLS